MELEEVIVVSMNGNSQNPLIINNTLNLYGGLPAQGLPANVGSFSANPALSNPMQLQQTPMTQDVLQMNSGVGLSGMMGNGVSSPSMGTGIAGSTLNLMTQITSMMATIMTGLMSFISQILSSSGSPSVGSTSGGNTSSLMASGGGGSSLQELVELSANLPRNRAEETPSSDSSSTETESAEEHSADDGHNHDDVRSLEDVNLPAGTSPAEANLVLPLDRQHVDRPSEGGDFGPRNINVAGASKNHKGNDFGAATGTPIYAAQAGTVELIQPASRGGGAGNYVIIDHGNGLKTRYLHMHDFADGLKVGDRLEAGQTIGGVGATGIGSGPHLHFEVIVNDVKVDPWPYLQQALA